MEPSGFFDTPERKSFLGTGWAFPPAFSTVRYEAVMVSDEEDIWQSLQILFNTSLGERVMLPDYGCNLRDYLFAPLNVTLLSYLEDLIRQAIIQHEPRIKLLNLTIIPAELEGRLDITVSYLIRSTNTRFNRVYPFYIQEGTNLSL
ncbi:GPW/gp25 family protein [Spirosoma areae]